MICSSVNRAFIGPSFCWADSTKIRRSFRGAGQNEYPVATGGAQPGWAGSETGDVPGPQAYTTVDWSMKPDQTRGVHMKITRKALEQAGADLEQAVRRDMSAAIQQEMDRVIFLGSGSGGEPLGVFSGAATYGITETAIDAPVTYAMFRAAAVRFITANAARGPGSVNLMLRPELFDLMDANYISGTSGSPLASNELLTTSTNGVAPIFCGMWGAVDLIRDPYSDAKSGQLRLTELTTIDVAVVRGVQLETLTGIE